MRVVDNKVKEKMIVEFISQDFTDMWERFLKLSEIRESMPEIYNIYFKSCEDIFLIIYKVKAIWEEEHPNIEFDDSCVFIAYLFTKMLRKEYSIDKVEKIMCKNAIQILVLLLYVNYKISNECILELFMDNVRCDNCNNSNNK